MSHTHWDREWYHTAERFRQRLVDLIDELLDGPGEGSFLLDGQTVVLEDYLDVRPERAGELAAALKAGKLEAGPWFVLPDELIPSGEGLVRNLLAGARTMRALRAESPSVLYCPDSFGHPASLPAIAAGFGKPVVIVWRGRRGDSDTFRWSHGADSVVAFHLSRSGYELGANLPADTNAARQRWARVREQLAPRANGVTLLLNGADHHARQRDLRRALDVLYAAAAPEEVRHGSMAAFSDALLRQARNQQLEDIRGELRDSYGYTWTLQGTLASRADQKRRYARCERDLVRDVEPWLAMVRLAGAPGKRHLARAAWRSLLLCQPHDSLCGCSIDAVSRAVSARLESTESQALGLRQDALATLVGHDVEAARLSPHAWRPVVMIRNRSPRARSGVAIVEIVEKIADVPVGLGSAIGGSSPKAKRSAAMSPFGQVLSSSVEFERTESPRAYPDNDEVRRSLVAVWCTGIPALGIRGHAIDAENAGSPPTNVSTVTVKGRTISNGLYVLRWDARGNVRLERTSARWTVSPLLRWESREDRGDLYTPSIRGKSVSARHLGSRVVHRGPLRATLEQTWEIRRAKEVIRAAVRLSLDSGSNLVRVDVSGANHASDHRLRLVFQTGVKNAVTAADAAFGSVERHAPRVDARAAKMERPVLTAPLHRYVSQFDATRGMTLFSDGLAEYESLDGAIAVTLVRAVGELSRNNLPERPGHAGWPAPTPDAQSHGRFGGSFALMLSDRGDGIADEIERAADDALLPLTGETLRSALRPPDDVHGPQLEGASLAFSAMKESEDGEWVVLRCVNLLDRNVAGAWRLRRLREARMSRLDETPGEPMAVQDGRVEFTARGREVLTILVR